MTGSIGLRFLGAGVLLITGGMAMRGQQTLPSTPDQRSTTMPAAESAVQPPVETPGEIYKAAMRPLEIVRNSLDNWSDAELGALSVGIHKAHDACEATKPADQVGDDLYDLARLCALGQDWSNTNAAALAYVASKQEAHRPQAYALSVNALVHMNATDLAVETTREMLRILPYDAEVAFAVRYMKDVLEQASNPVALKLASEEHAAIVVALAQNAPLKAVNGDAVMTLGALYDSAMELAFWQRYAGDDVAASATVADVDHALLPNAPLNAEDTARIAAVRLRYSLLGERLPEIKPLRALESVTAKPQITTSGSSFTVLVLFPDWCGGCRKMMKPLTEFEKANKDTPIRAYGLVFDDNSVVPIGAAREELLNELKGTATLLVPSSTAQSFGADDYPLGILLDRAGKVRFIGVLPADAFKGGGYVENTILKTAAVDPGSGTGVKSPKSH